MTSYLLKNYQLSGCELFQSLFVSEYGLRHLAQTKKDESRKWGHRLIAAIELCPVIGLVATLIEAIVAKCIRSVLSKENPLPKEWVFQGTQSDCEGAVVIAKVESIRAKLEASHPLGISFNPQKIKPYLMGGTCSAMSMEFLNSYFKERQVCVQQSDQRSEMLVNRIRQMGQQFASSSYKMRTLQAAYNTIEVIQPDSAVDHTKNKVQSLANYYSFAIDYASPEIHIDKLRDENDLSQTVQALPEGAFFVRIIEYENNKKLEKSGHSLVYIKENGLGVFYEPNQGALKLPELRHTSYLYEAFKSCWGRFQVSRARFYRFHPALLHNSLHI